MCRAPESPGPYSRHYNERGSNERQRNPTAQRPTTAGDEHRRCDDAGRRPPIRNPDHRCTHPPGKPEPHRFDVRCARSVSMLEPAHIDHGHIRHQRATSAAFMRQTNDTLTQVQRQLSQLVEAQTNWMTEQMRKNMDEFTRRTGENLKHWREASRPGGRRSRAHCTVGPAGNAVHPCCIHNTPSIVVSGGLDGTRSQQARTEERGKAAAKR